MANGEDKSKSRDFYQVLGLNKECTASELRNAYKKLAMRWHPDRSTASGNSKVEEAKQNFQEIQQAYSVLSDANKRFLYDVGAYDSDDVDENGMGDFLNEMAVLMSQTKPNENGNESYEELQELFEELFQDDIESFGASCQVTSSSSSSSSYPSYSENSSSNSKWNSSGMNSRETTRIDSSSGFSSHFQKFCLGVEHQQNFKGKGARGGVQGGAGGSRMRQSRKQNVSSRLDVSSSQDHGISA